MLCDGLTMDGIGDSGVDGPRDNVSGNRQTSLDRVAWLYFAALFLLARGGSSRRVMICDQEEIVEVEMREPGEDWEGLHR